MLQPAVRELSVPVLPLAVLLWVGELRPGNKHLRLLLLPCELVRSPTDRSGRIDAALTVWVLKVFFPSSRPTSYIGGAR